MRSPPCTRPAPQRRGGAVAALRSRPRRAATRCVDDHRQRRGAVAVADLRHRAFGQAERVRHRPDSARRAGRVERMRLQRRGAAQHAHRCGRSPCDARDFQAIACRAPARLRPCRGAPTLGAMPARSAGEVGELEAGSASAPPSARSTRQPGRASPGSLPPATRALLAAFEVGQRRFDFRQRPIGRITSATRAGRLAGEVAEGHDLRRAQRLQRARAVGEVQARLDAVDARRPRAARPASPAHRAPVGSTPWRARPSALAPCGMRHSAAPVAAAKPRAAARIAAACGLVLGQRADDDHRAAARPAARRAARPRRARRRAATARTMLLAGEVEGEVEIDRIDRRAPSRRACQALRRRWCSSGSFVAQVASRR